MAELPKLSASIRRLQTLRWAVLLSEHGFTGDHFKWHESKERRREAAKPSLSLAPPPPATLRDRSRGTVTYYGSRGEPISYDQWKQEQMAAWASRENDPRSEERRVG